MYNLISTATLTVLGSVLLLYIGCVSSTVIRDWLNDDSIFDYTSVRIPLFGNEVKKDARIFLHIAVLFVFGSIAIIVAAKVWPITWSLVIAEAVLFKIRKTRRKHKTGEERSE